MKYMVCDKMILAVLQEDDYLDIVQDLADHGVYSTLLNSTGGFLKKKSVTVMMGIENEKLDMVLDILKRHAGKRMETEFVVGGVGLTISKQAPKAI